MKRPTQQDVARIAGVSRATVSIVANGQMDSRVPISAETRARVLQAIEELGYEPDARAQALRSGDTKIIGVTVPDIRNPHFWDNVLGIEQEAHAAGYSIMFTSLGQRSEYAPVILKDLLRQRVDGLILMGTYVGGQDLGKTTLEHLHRRLSIVEITDGVIPDHPIDAVYANYRQATREVLTHLYDLGHRQIGFIFGVAFEPLGRDRLDVYNEYMQAAGLPCGPDWVIRCGPEIEDGYQAARQILRRPNRPTALLVINDLLAMGVIRAATDLGLEIPRDLSIVGYDNIFADDYLVPRLTTVTKEAIGMGRAAARLLIQRIEEPNRPQQTIEYIHRLILRESTGPAPAVPPGHTVSD